MEMESTFVPGVADPAQPWLNRQDKIVMRPAAPRPTPTRPESVETLGQKLSRLFVRASEADPETKASFVKEAAANEAFTATLNELPMDTRMKVHAAAMDLINAYTQRVNQWNHAGFNAVVGVLFQNITFAQAETRKAKAASPVSGGQPDIQIELPPIHVHLPDSLNLTVNDGQKSELVMEQSADGRETRVRRRDSSVSRLAIAGTVFRSSAPKVHRYRRRDLRKLAAEFRPRKAKGRRGVKSRAGWQYD